MSIEAKVGAFVLVSILVLGVSIYSVTHVQNVKGQLEFKTYLRYAGGLAAGAPVLFGGIKVGQVETVGPSAEDPTLIEIRFNVRGGTPLNQDSIAHTGTVTLMGTPALLITTGSNDAKRLRPGEAVRAEEAVSLDEITRRVATVAESANTVMAEILQDIPLLTDKAQAALANVGKITGPANQQRIAGILEELNTTLERESPKISQITDQIASLTQNADSVVASAKPIMPNANNAVIKVNDILDGIREPLTKDLTELQDAIQQASRVLAGLQNVLGANGQDLAETAENLRAASENIRSLTETLKERPWNLIRTTQPSERKVPQ